MPRLDAGLREATARQVSAWEREIDQLVYALYGLTPDEIKIGDHHWRVRESYRNWSMGRPHDVASLLREGLSPAEMAKRLGISTGSVRQYLWVAVGEGLIRPSDVLFSLPRTLRKEAGTIIRENKPKTVSDLQRELYKRGVGYDREELQMLWNLMGGTIHHHLYEFIINTEKALHDKIREILQEKFGNKESGWWRQGAGTRRRRGRTLRIHYLHSSQRNH